MQIEQYKREGFLIGMEGTQLAGPAAGSYDGGQKMSSHKRKRDKAQEQLRTRMRQRMNGNDAPSTLVHSKRRNTLLDGKGELSLSASMRHSSTMEVTARDLQGSNYWRTQNDRYNTLNQSQTSRPPRISKNHTVPLQELVDRVLHRKEHNFGLGTKASPMTIRAYKPPVAPYAIQQSSLVKKMVMMKPIQREARDDKGPFVLVLQRDGSDETQTKPRGRRRLRSNTNADLDEYSDNMRDNEVLPPVNASKTAAQSELEMKTWRPALDKVHQSPVLPEAEDRSVTNYRLELQRANKLAESRFEFQHQVGLTSGQTVEEMTMQSRNPLPPIHSVISGDAGVDLSDVSLRVTEFSASDGDGAPGNNHQHDTMSINGNDSGVDRTSSKDEILNMKKARKEAKRQKQAEEEFTLLRTRKRFTNKTKQFKSELQRARQLSAIQEDRSSLSSARLSLLSGRKATLTSASSSSSLGNIDETKISNASAIDLSVRDESGGGDSVRSVSEQSNHTLPRAPPSTPSVADDRLINGAILNDDVMSSVPEDSDESDADSSMEASGTTSSSDESLSSSSSSLSFSKDSAKNPPQPEVIQGDDVTEEMTWVDGEVPFRENSLTSFVTTDGHGGDTSHLI